MPLLCWWRDSLKMEFETYEIPELVDEGYLLLLHHCKC